MEAAAAGTSAAAKRAWLVLNGLTLAVGNCGGPLVMRLYYHGGGRSVWFTAFLETGGWPFLLIPLAFAYAGGDRPEGETDREYFLGFFMTLLGAMLYGLVLPSIERTYQKARQAVTYTLVMEVQLVMGFCATAFCTAGILISKDYQAIAREAVNFKFGESMYILVVLANAVMWQCFYVGAIGVIFYGSSLLSSIIIHALLPTTELLAVIIYKEKFHSEKGVALFLCLWGFTSYFYGQFKEEKENKKNCVSENDQTCEQVTV